VSSNGLFVRLNDYYYTRTAVVFIFETILSQGVMTRTCGWCAAFLGHATAETQYNDFSLVLLLILIYIILTKKHNTFVQVQVYCFYVVRINIYNVLQMVIATAHRRNKT